MYDDDDDINNQEDDLHPGDLGYETDGTNAEQQAIYEAFEYADNDDDVALAGDDDDHPQYDAYGDEI